MRKLTGQFPDPGRYAGKLKAYGCTDKQISDAKNYLWDVFHGKQDCHPVGDRILKMVGE